MARLSPQIFLFIENSGIVLNVSPSLSEMLGVMAQSLPIHPSLALVLFLFSLKNISQKQLKEGRVCFVWVHSLRLQSIVVGKCGGEILAMVLGTYGNSSQETDESGVSIVFPPL